MQRFFVLLMTSLMFIAAVEGQSTFLDRIGITQSNGRVAISWTISSGNTCDGIEIQRSSDARNFYLIHEIEGICGSVIQPTDYRYIDEEPLKNRLSYYRLIFGNAGISDILSIEVIDYGTDGYIIKPNPLINEGKVYFQNDKGEVYDFYLYSLSGERIISLQTSTNHFAINASELSSGLYFFTIISADKKSLRLGKLAVN